MELIKSDKMSKILKIMPLVFLIINIEVVFANNDWIVFPTENRNIYPIIFGKIEDPTNIVNCANNLTPTYFSPGQSSNYVNIFSNCYEREDHVIFFLRNKENQIDVRSLVAREFFRYYFISTNLKYGAEGDQSLTLNFTFKQS